MNVAGIYKCGRTCRRRIASHHDALIIGLWQVLSFTPQLRCKRDVSVGLFDLAFTRPSCCTVLAVTDRLSFDVVEVIDVCKYRDGSKHHKHHDGNDD